VGGFFGAFEAEGDAAKVVDVHERLPSRFASNLVIPT
jgi:hypothetical protein